MARFIFFIVIAFILYYALYFLMKGPFLRKTGNKRGEPEELVQDPYCQTYVPKGSAVKKRIAGKDCYFCNSECLKKYLEKSTC